MAAFEVHVHPSQVHGSVKAGYLGVSHEWPHVEDLAVQPAFVTIFKNLMAFGADYFVLRIGGASQDRLTQVPSDDVWRALSQLAVAVPLKFIIGLPLAPSNPHLACEVMQAAQRHLPPSSILCYELGNEPDYWEGQRVWGFDPPAPQQFLGFETYLQRWEYTAQCLAATSAGGTAHAAPAPAGADSGALDAGAKSGGLRGRLMAKLKNKLGEVVDHSGGGGIGGGAPAGAACAAGTGALAGPSWAHSTKLGDQRLAGFLGCSRGHLGSVTAHYYPSYPNKALCTADSMLSEGYQTEAATRFARMAGIARQAGLPFIITEANTCYAGGQPKVSESFGAALWTVDAGLEFAAAGAVHTCLHWGSGRAPAPAYVGVQYNPDPRFPGGLYPSVHMPYYGYVMLAKVVGRGGRFLGFSASSNPNSSRIKVWPLLDAVDGSTLRVCIVHKGDGANSVPVTLKLDGSYGNAVVERMDPGASGGLMSITPECHVAGFSWYGCADGVPKGQPRREVVAAVSAPGLTTYSFGLRAASVVLLTIPRV